MSRIAVLSDVHGNMFALQKVMQELQTIPVDGLVLLGDLIDYGMQSNEVVHYFAEENPFPVLVNIWGNHEHAIMEEQYDHFSSKRGVECARYTSSILSAETRTYLNEQSDHNGWKNFILDDTIPCLAIHGSLDNCYWDAIGPDHFRGDYAPYDIVFSGHSHLPHAFSHFYPIENPEYRNKKKTIFINPGSVGQPRNHNPRAQFALFDTDTYEVILKSVLYDVEKAKRLYDHKPVDAFYRDRLTNGV